MRKGIFHLVTGTALAVALSVSSAHVPVVPLPDFDDAFKTQQVLEAAMVSAEQKRAVPIDGRRCSGSWRP